MTTIIRNVTFDAADPGALARWWAQVFDSEVVFDDGHEAAFDLPSEQTVFFQRVPEGKHDEPRTAVGVADTIPGVRTAHAMAAITSGVVTPKWVAVTAR